MGKKLAPVLLLLVVTAHAAKTKAPAPSASKERKLLTGQIYHYQDRFAIYSWKERRIAFYQIPSGAAIFMADDPGVEEPLDREKYVSNKTFSLCPEEYFYPKSGVCTELTYPEPIHILQTEAPLEVKIAGITNKSQYLLVSTEKYRAAENTGLHPVKNPLYAVLDLSGKEVFKLPPFAITSTNVITSMAIVPEEPAALFGIGEMFETCDAEEDYSLPARIREVWIWSPKAGIQKVDTTKRTEGVDALIKRFGVNPFLFKFTPIPADYNPHGC